MLPRDMPSKIRDRICATAVRRFSATGFHGTSTKEIAKSANVTEGSLFRLFESKEKLFSECLGHALASKKIGRIQLRLAIYALLEEKGLSEENCKLLRRLWSRYPVLNEIKILSKL